MKLEKVSKLTGIIHCVGNLHIGGSKDTIEIGGMDNPVIKHPVTNEPYIPGSSLKGKMRCSVEREAGKPGSRACGCGDPLCAICVVFGSLGNRNLGPTRLIVRDAMLTEESREKIFEFISAADQSYVSVKYENSINRRTGKADNPRPIEFVPSDTDFELNISVLIYDVDNGKGYFDLIKQGLRAVEDTYLGGMGSRGYGQVEFLDLKLDGAPFSIRDAK